MKSNPKGTIETEFIVFCGNDECDHYEYINCEHQPGKRLKENTGWKLTKNHGWVCPECAKMFDNEKLSMSA